MTKRTYIYIMTLSFLFLGIGCDSYDNIIPAEFDTILSIKEVGEQDISFYDVGKDDVYTMILLKGGIKPENSATAELNVLTDAELVTYSENVGKPYKALPASLYEIPEKNVNFSANEQYLRRDIVFKTSALRTFLESAPNANYVLPIVLVSSKDSVNADKKLLLLHPTEVRIPQIGFENETATLKSIKGLDKYDFELMVPFNNPWDIVVDLTVNESLVAIYNSEYGTNYPVLPANAYNLTSSQLTIPSEAKKGSVTITFNDDQIPYEDFLLPIELTSTSKLTLDETKKVHYILISKLNLLDRTGWTIADFSSEEKTGEGAGNGLASCVLDGDVTKFWHSKWQGGSAQLPHYFTIDMKKEFLVTAVDLQRRVNQKDTKAGILYISSDNVTFTEIGLFHMEDTNEVQSFKVTETRGRYLKVEVTESNRPPFVNMAEVYVRGFE